MSLNVLQIGSELRVDTALARAFCAHGARYCVFVLSPDTKASGCRYIDRYFKPTSISTVLEDLCKLLSTDSFDLITVWGDRALNLISQHRNTLPTSAYIACPEIDQAKKILNKNLTLEIAHREMVPTPETIADIRHCQAAHILNRLGTPVVVKPADKGMDAAFKLCLAYDEHGLERIQQAVIERPEIYLAQSRVSGHPVAIDAFRIDTMNCFMLQQRSLRELPASGGNSVLARTEPPLAELTGAASRLLQSLEWQGVAQVEFMHNPDTEEFWLMEVNGRYWSSVGLALTAGFDIPGLQIAVARGQSPKLAQTPRLGLSQHWLGGDIRRLRRNIVDGQGWWQTAIEIFQLAGNTLGGHTRAIFRLRDPIPALRDFRDIFRPY